MAEEAAPLWIAAPSSDRPSAGHVHTALYIYLLLLQWKSALQFDKYWINTIQILHYTNSIQTGILCMLCVRERSKRYRVVIVVITIVNDYNDKFIQCLKTNFFQEFVYIFLISIKLYGAHISFGHLWYLSAFRYKFPFILNLIWFA